LRLKFSDASSPFVISAKAEIQRKANGKTAAKLRGNAINRIVPFSVIPAFAGMTENGIASILQRKKNHSKLFPPTLSPFIPYFFKRLVLADFEGE
jgi:hypothetical protein